MWGHLRVGESQRTCEVTPVYRRNWPQMRGVGEGLGAEILFYSTGNTRLCRVDWGSCTLP